MHPLPRAIAVQYPEGELIFPSGVKPMWLDYSYDAMGLRTFGKSTEFLRDERFLRAHARGWACAGRKRRHIDDIRWNMHVALWAASQAARLPGDFVECGVDNGMLSVGICEWLDFNRMDRDFWLFDTFDGIPESQMSAAERAGIGSWHNRESYRGMLRGRASELRAVAALPPGPGRGPGHARRLPRRPEGGVPVHRHEHPAARNRGAGLLLGPARARRDRAARRLWLDVARRSAGWLRRLCPRPGDARPDPADRSGADDPLGEHGQTPCP